MVCASYSSYHEVGVRHEIHGDGNIVQSVRFERVVGFEDGVEIVRVPVVADEAEDGDPQVGFQYVPLSPRQLLITLDPRSSARSNKTFVQPT